MLKSTMMIGSALAVISAVPASAEFGDTLATVKERGSLSCTGHNGSYPGLAEVDDQQNWTGFDIDLCRALATAIFGTHEGHLDIQPTSWAQRWPSLQSGDLDIVIKGSTWTRSRDTNTALQFSRPYMLTEIQYATHAALGAEKATDLDGGSICVQAGTTYPRYVNAHSQVKGYELETVSFESTEEAKSAFASGRCDAYIDWNLQLALLRSSQGDDGADVQILPDTVAAEPLGMVMRQGDDQWVDISNWLLSALFMAEEEGVTSENVDDMRADPPTPGIAKLLGATPGVGDNLGLDDDWAYNVIKVMGNYGEMWERNLGAGSPYKLERGVNALIRDGGIMHSLVMD